MLYSLIKSVGKLYAEAGRLFQCETLRTGKGSNEIEIAV